MRHLKARSATALGRLRRNIIILGVIFCLIVLVGSAATAFRTRVRAMEHAERNAILSAAREGRALAGGRIASTLFPCIDCARAIVISGIATLVTYPPPLDDPIWGASFPRSRIILEEGGVNLVFLEPKS